MAGQVWNWTSSADYPLPFDLDREAKSADQLNEPRIIRGGSWKRGLAKTYTYHRESQMPIPYDYPNEIGFRLSTDQDPTRLFEGWAFDGMWFTMPNQYHTDDGDQENWGSNQED